MEVEQEIFQKQDQLKKNKKSKIPQHNLVGEDLSKDFDLSKFSSKSIDSLMRRTISIFEEKLTIGIVPKEVKHKFDRLIGILKKTEESFENCFMKNNFPFDSMVRDPVLDLKLNDQNVDEQIDKKYESKSALNIFNDLPTKNTKISEKKRSLNKISRTSIMGLSDTRLFDLISTGSKTKKTKQIEGAYRKRSLSWFSLAYSLYDTFWNLKRLIKKWRCPKIYVKTRLKKFDPYLQLIGKLNKAIQFAALLAGDREMKQKKPQNSGSRKNMNKALRWEAKSKRRSTFFKNSVSRKKPLAQFLKRKNQKTLGQVWNNLFTNVSQTNNFLHNNEKQDPKDFCQDPFLSSSLSSLEEFDSTHSQQYPIFPQKRGFKKNRTATEQQDTEGIDPENYEHFFISTSELSKLSSELLELKEPIAPILVYQFSKQLKTTLRTFNALNAACIYSCESNHMVVRGIKYSLSYAKHFLMRKTAARKSAKAKINPSVKWLRATWGLTEANRFLRWLAYRPYPSIKMEAVRYIDIESIKISESTKNNPFFKKKPQTGSLIVRIISNKSEPMEAKRFIMFIHGGGFVAGGSLTHAPYLRRWAKECNCTVICPKYTLSPEAKIPEQIHECLQTYKWLIAYSPNSKIMIAGDSAGGNIATGLIRELILCGIRKPDGVILGYPPFYISKKLSISRVLYGNEPLFSIPVFGKCVDSCHPDPELQEKKTEDPQINEKTTMVDKDANYEKVNLNQKIPRSDMKSNGKLKKITKLKKYNSFACTQDLFLDNEKSVSPLLMSDQVIKEFPKTLLTGGIFDPGLDDFSLFADRFRLCGSTNLKVKMYGMPHSFFVLGSMFPEAKRMMDDMIKFILSIFDVNK
ncbi:hormone-sensitive lipase [Anaeramoeba flamelloides]|uniref:Hormone-sensitive lipase n=1 Tax=Anaeramoeba flamelloides TaxID=1746091 RepID=A0ABQ8XH27_9EUKA|nr:hormone-sensitive lipase [Anaeramoeba flamelloides]